MDPALHARMRPTRSDGTHLTTLSADGTNDTNRGTPRQQGRAITHALTRTSARKPDHPVLNLPIGGSRLKHYHQKGSDRDISRALETNVRDRRTTDQQVQEHTETAKAALEELVERVKQARAGRLSTKQLATLRNDLMTFARYIGGDGEGGKWVGIKNTYDRHYEQLDGIDADPAAHVDAFWKKWGPSLGVDRFDVRD